MDLEKARELGIRLSEDEDFCTFMNEFDERLTMQMRQYMTAAPANYDQRELEYLGGQMAAVAYLKKQLTDKKRTPSNGRPKHNR